VNSFLLICHWIRSGTENELHRYSSNDMIGAEQINDKMEKLNSEADYYRLEKE
jgi:hypothetical protein